MSVGGLTAAGAIANVAIDFGTSYSGFSFLFKDRDIKTTKSKRWPPDETVKVPTCILINKSTGKYISFGHEARDGYARQSHNADSESDGDESELERKSSSVSNVDNLFFQNFKMQLYDYDEGEQKDAFTIRKYIKAKCGNKMKSLVVFRESIRFMKDEALKMINELQSGITAEDICWILTVPGMGSVHAKAFMRKAAESAGLGDIENIQLALEPEAASFYVRQDLSELDVLENGEKYMIVDAGGGTVDFACHKVELGGVVETHCATGSPCGSSYLDKEFYKQISKVFPDFKHIAQKTSPAALALEKNWTKTKHTTLNLKDLRFVEIPVGICEGLGGSRKMKSMCRRYNGGRHLKYTEGSLGISGDMVEMIFTPVLQMIRNKIKKIFKNKDVKGTRRLILVGGFGKSDILMDYLKKSFPKMKILRPASPEEAVLLGAIQYSRKPTEILSRKMQSTYGVGAVMPWEDGDPFDKQYENEDGELGCDDRFMIYAKKGQSVKLNDTIKDSVIPTFSSQRSVNFTFYSSTRYSPRYVDESGCLKLGRIRVPVPEGDDRHEKKIYCEFKFGGTEIQTITKARGLEEEHYFTIKLDE